MATAPAREGILTVTELTRRIKIRLEEGFPAVWVRGEISGFKLAPSGHRYFSLKDPQSVLDCALYANEAARVRFQPKDGMAVEAFGRISLFEPRGRYQLIVEAMRPAGLGDRLLALEELKRRLQAEGLFDAASKKPLPTYPRRVGLVTSPSGAAVRDMIKIMRSRWPSIAIVIAPVRVQGEGASVEIAEAIRLFNSHALMDVLIVGRGGGSIEDLWAFNEEPVVRAIAASAIPVVSAVGHEVDTTLADLVADRRAATPSNAAEIVVPERRAVRVRVDHMRSRIDRILAHRLASHRQHLDGLLAKYAFRRPREVFQVWARRVADRLERLQGHMRWRLAAVRHRLERARDAYGLRAWPERLAERREDVNHWMRRLQPARSVMIARRRERLAGYTDRLRALSPRLVMERGYCLVRRPDGTLLRSSDGLAVGELLDIEFARGEADARVEAVRRGDDDGQ